MSNLECLEFYNEYCNSKMMWYAGHGDIEGFEKWLKLYSKVNKAIDKEMNQGLVKML